MQGVLERALSLALAAALIAPVMAAGVNASGQDGEGGAVGDTSPLMKQYITGGLAEKTRAVTSSTGKEAYTLSRAAMSYSIAYKPLLGDDKELTALAVAAVLSLNRENIAGLDDSEKSSLTGDLCSVLQLFSSDDSVRSAVISRALQLKDKLPLGQLVECLNLIAAAKQDASDVVNALSQIGDERSFAVLYTLPDTEDALAAILCRVPAALYAATNVIQKGNNVDVSCILRLAQRYDVNDNLRGEIAEAALKKVVLQTPGDKAASEGAPDILVRALAVLKEIRWTRSSKVVYEALSKEMEEGVACDTLCQTIDAASVLSPIDSQHLITSLLTMKVQFLGEGTGAMDANKDAIKVINACIKALGAIGDKSAFDALLAVTNASGIDRATKDSANMALSQLKW